MTTPLAQALAYVERGWPVLPVEPRGKRPNAAVLKSVYGTPSWEPLRRRPASRPEVQAWYEADPTTNLAIITGNGLAVLDIDRRCGAPRLPDTAIASTGRGWHVYLRSDLGVRTQRFGWGELRSEGAYVVAPASVHPTGARYEWLTAPDGELADLADMPVALDAPSKLTPEAAYQGPYMGLGTGALTQALAAGGAAYTTVLKTLDTDEAFVSAFADLLGISLKQSFCCVLPGHAELNPSANLWRDERGVYVYRDHHGRGERAAYDLTAIYAAVRAGRQVTLTRKSLPRWRLRLCHELGLFERPAVNLPDLPRGASPEARRLRDGFELLYSIRLAAGDSDPTPYTRLFAAAWCGLTSRQADAAKVELLNARVIEKVGTYPVGDGAMSLYAPGKGRAAR